MFDEPTIIIDIKNNLLVMATILARLTDDSNTTGWMPYSNVTLGGMSSDFDLRYYGFFFNRKIFAWVETCYCYYAQVIDTEDDANRLVDFVFVNVNSFKIDPNFDYSKIPPAPKKFTEIHQSDMYQFFSFNKVFSKYDKTYYDDYIKAQIDNYKFSNTYVNDFYDSYMLSYNSITKPI